MNKKILIIIIAAALCLTACLIAFAACGSPKVTGVKSLVAANIKAQSDVENYHLDGRVDMDITLDPEKSGKLEDILGSVNLKLPVKMTQDADAGKETAHIVTDASAKVLGKKIPVQKGEVYLDMKNQVAYSRTEDSAKWKKTGDEKEQMEFYELAGGLAILGKTVLENASFEETEEYYSLTLPAEKAGDLVADQHLLDRVDLGIADVRDITVEGGQIVYNVDKTTLLVDSIELKDVDIRGKGTYEGKSVDLIFPTNAVFRLSQYNEVEESRYAIPEEVTGAKQ